jgi:aminocarboxymuconate-semialdehyde decarboxylase
VNPDFHLKENDTMIDFFTHVVPPKYKRALSQSMPELDRRISGMPTLYDMDQRFRIMDNYQGLTQVLTLSLTAALVLDNPGLAVDYAKRSNDEMAELVAKYPNRFAAATASLPMTDMEAALKELDRAIIDLKLRGLQLFTPTLDKPLDSPEFLPLFARMAEHDLPIWIHPVRWMDRADYRTLKQSKYYIYHIFGWPYETTAAMVHLVFSGILDRFPGIKIIAHHCGGMVPFYEQKIVEAYEASETIHAQEYKSALRKPPIDYFKMFYGDTALNGSAAGLMCGYKFFGADHLLFATDMPFDVEFGNRGTRKTIESVEALGLSAVEKKMVYEENAKRLLRL